VSEDLGGKLIGRYELHERIGRGGMAEVYKAYHAPLDRYVALKILHPFLGEDPQFKERFGKEARNVAQLRHPNIVQVYDFDVDNPRELYYMVMEYIDGPTLRARLTQQTFQGASPDIPEAIRITRDLASALNYAHARGMIHRDLKPGNIMFDSDNRVVLTDFGIARIVNGPNVTASGSMIGTPTYMSPEQGLGQSGDHRSDIYSLGIVLYQLITGTTPFNADTPIAVVLKHVNDPLPPPTNINPEIPDSLERIIYKALAKSPEERYQAVDEMSAHLQNLEAASQLIIPNSSKHGGVYSITSSSGQYTDLLIPDVAPRGNRGVLGWLLLLIALFAMIGGIYVSFSGILARFIPPTNTPYPIQEAAPIIPSSLMPTIEMGSPTPTEDVRATELSSTVAALSALVVTPSANVVPDLTATAIACDFDYELLNESPETGSPYPALTSLTKRIRIINDSKCPLDDDTRLVFAEGSQLEGPDFVEFNHQIDPQEEYEIVLDLQTPALDSSNPIVVSSWRIVLPSGQQVGPLFTFTINVFSCGG